jgi:serine/threonine-protein kinase HipA
MASDRDRIVVHLDADDLGPRREVGTLARESGAGRSVVSFAYRSEWIAAADSFPIDPALSLFEGEQYPPTLPGILADAAPDRWGRTLLERREAHLARREDRERRHLEDWDFLVGVDDRTRMGALRLTSAVEGTETFLAAGSLPVPPLARLRDLEHWAREAEIGLAEELSEEERWLAMLVAPGSSLGGARPKANYLDDGALWIAKFPSREDRHDVGAWEHVVSRLAAAAGIDVPETRLLSLGSVYRTFCAKRFDRLGDRRRLYASAMTLAGRRDHEDASYLDIARAIENLGDPVAIDEDLHQLYRRVVFNVLTANRDDHLRNHGFLRAAGGWRLSPAFDVNPSPRKLEHSLAFDGSLREADLALVLDTARYYRLSTEEAGKIVDQVSHAVAGWPELARQAELRGDELERIGAAFVSA